MRSSHPVGAPPGHDLRAQQLTPDPADPRELARLLARHRLRARHRLGQNFLVDPELRDRVLEAAELRADEEVLEVGAGLGTLTIGLARRCRRLVAVELDERLAGVLRELTGDLGNVEILVHDVLELDLRALFPHGGEVVVGNIPYYLTGALLPKLLQDPPRPRRLSLLLQKEVAERLTAPGGWSLATVAVQVFAEPELVLTLPAAAFQPPPKVDSALVRLRVREQPAVEVPDLDAFFSFVEQVFQFRRKQLRASLARVAGISGQAAADRLLAAGVDPSRRPETLSLDEWGRVYESATT